jgi:transposase
LKKLSADAEALLTLLRRWQGEATKTGSTLNRIVVAFEAGRDGFWLARWLRTRGIGAYVIHPTSIRCRANIGEQRRTGSSCPVKRRGSPC